MNQTIDELLDEIKRLSAAIDDADDAPADLVTRREQLRREAARRSAALRHPESVRTEVERIEQRLAEFEQQLIRAGHSEKHLQRTIQDPGAYRHTINRLLEENQAAELEELTDRLNRLRRPIDGNDD